MYFTSTNGGEFTRNGSSGNVVSFDHGRAVDSMQVPVKGYQLYDTIGARLVTTETGSSGREVVTALLDVRPVGGARPSDPDHIAVTNILVDNAYSMVVTFRDTDVINAATLNANLGAFRISRNSNAITGGPPYNLNNNTLWVSPVGYTPHYIQNASGAYVLDPHSVRLQLLQNQALTDNTYITLAIRANSGPPANTNFTYVTNTDFTATRLLTDTLAPWVLGLDDSKLPEEGLLRVHFSEPVVTHAGGVLATAFAHTGFFDNWTLNSQSLTAADIQWADPLVQPGGLEADVHINTEGYHPSTHDRDNLDDNRCWIDLKLSVAGLAKLNPMVGGKNTLQIRNIMDFAGLTQNVWNDGDTQTFTFLTPVKPDAPKFEIRRESVEQFRIIPDTMLLNPLLPGNITFEHLNGFLSSGLPDWQVIQVHDVADILEDQKIVTLTYLTPAPGRPYGEYLLEMNADWTIIKDTTYKGNGSGNSYSTADHDRVMITISTSRTGYNTPTANHITNLWGVPIDSPPDIHNSTNLTTNPNNDAVSQSNPSVIRLPWDAVAPKPQTVAIADDVRDYTPPSEDGAPATAFTNIPLNRLTDLGIDVRMNEPVQINTSNEAGSDGTRSTPLSPSKEQLTLAGIDYRVSTTNYIFPVASALPYMAIQPASAEFRNVQTGKTIAGIISYVSPDDFRFTVIPDPATPAAQQMKAGETWDLAVTSIPDDVGFTLNEMLVRIHLTPATVGPTGNPFVVWMTAHDNLYDWQNNQYVIGDLLYIQYSEPMDYSTVNRPQDYMLNGARFDLNLRVDCEEAIYFDAAGDQKVGTLVTIHAPYRQLGDDLSRFITETRSSLLDPYAPIVMANSGQSNALTIPFGATSADGAKRVEKLRQPGGNPAEYYAELTYTYAPIELGVFEIQPHIKAYVNSLETTFASQEAHLAYINVALASDQVKGIILTDPLRNASNGLTNNLLLPGANITNANQIVYDHVGEFSFSVPKSILIGDVTIQAPNALAVTVDVNANSVVVTNAPETAQAVFTSTLGILEFDLPKAEIKLGGSVTMATATSIGPEGLTIAPVKIGDAIPFIGTLNLAGGEKVLNSGEIRNLNISTSGTVTLGGTYVYGSNPGDVTVINLNQYTCVKNDTGETLRLNNIPGGGTISIPAGDAYPSGGEIGPIETAILAQINGMSDTIVLSGEGFSADLYETVFADSNNGLSNTLSDVRDNGGANGVAITNALYSVGSGTLAVGDVANIIEDALEAFGDIVEKIEEEEDFTNADLVDLFEKAGIRLVDNSGTPITVASTINGGPDFPETITFVTLQEYISSL
jgi:hypothetical protein